MTIKPRFMPNKPGFNPWDPSGTRGVPLATALSFSSKSPFRYDDWERDKPRPFVIVALTSYKPLPMTQALRNDGDYVWFDRPVEKPTIIWDGFCAVALWEVVYEAFREGSYGSRLRVRDNMRKVWCDDRRSRSLLATRPARSTEGLDPVGNPYGYAMAQLEHRKALASWAHACSQKETGGYLAQADWRLTSKMYHAVIAPKLEKHTDSARRHAMAEAKWNRNHLAPLVDDSGYRSPVSFMDEDLSRQARRAFEKDALIAQKQAQARRREFEATPALEPPRPSLWGRLFGA